MIDFVCNERFRQVDNILGVPTAVRVNLTTAFENRSVCLYDGEWKTVAIQVHDWTPIHPPTG